MDKKTIRNKMMKSIHLRETVDGVAEKCINSNLRDYQIFGNTVQDGEPAIDNPVEVVSVGELVNFIDVSQCEDGTIMSSNGQVALIPNRVRTGYIYLKKGSYCLSTIGTENDIIFGGYCHKYSSEDTTTWLGIISCSNNISINERNYKTFTLDEDCYCRFVLLPSSTSSITNLNINNISNYKPQLEDGNMPTLYKPYGTVKIPIVASGNLIKPITEERTGTINGITYTIKTDGSIILNGTATTGTTFYMSASYGSNNSFKLFKNERIVGDVYYSGSCKKETGEKGYGVAFKMGIKELDSGTLVEKTIVNNFNSLGSLNINTTSEIYDYKIYFYKGVYENFVIKPLVVRGLTAPDEFIPYVSVPKTNYIYLSEPLHKIGDYQDYIDFRNRCVIRNCAFQKFNSAQDWMLSSSNSVGNIMYYKLSKNRLGVVDGKANALLNNCKAVSSSVMTPPANLAPMSVVYGGGNNYMYVFVGNEIASTIAEWKTWLDNNDMHIVYVLSSPTIEDIELPKLPQFKGTTIYQIATNIPSEFVGTYKTRL